MSLRNILRRMRETLTQSQPEAAQRRRSYKLELDRLEDRLAPVVGFNQPPPVAAGVGWDGVVELEWNNGSAWVQLCTGSLLSSGRHILTAAHCLTDTNGRINVATTRVSFTLPNWPTFLQNISIDVPQANYRIHPNWRGGSTSWDNDIAILDLPVLAPSGPRGTGVDRYDIYRSTNELTVSDGIFTFLGYGRTGNGNTGDNVASRAKRLGGNRFERVQGTRLQFDFDNGTTTNDVFRTRYSIPNTGIGLTEAMNAPGDSGGPSFLSGQIAAVTSTRWNCGCTADILAGGNSSFGDWGEYTRVSSYAGWIDGILGSPHNLVLDMNSQRVGWEAGADTIEVRRAGSFIDIYVNGLHYHRDSYSLVNSVFLRGSGARDVFIVTDNLVGRSVVVDGRDGNDEVIISNDVATPESSVFSDSVYVRSTNPIYYSNVEQLTLNASDGDLVYVRSTAASTPLIVSGAGRVHVGNGGQVANVRGTVTVRNPPSYTALTIDNSSDAVTRSVTLSSTGLTGLAPAAINWVQNDLRSLTIWGGNGLNTYRIENTPSSGVAGGLVTTLRGGTGIDTMNVLRTTGRLVIDGNGNLDVVNIGNAGSVAEVLAAIDVSNPPGGGYTALTVDASAFTGSYTATLTSTSLSFGGPAINFVQGDLRSLTIRGGRGASTYNILNTPQSGFTGGVTTTLFGGIAVDTVNIRATTGVINVSTGGGSDVVNLGDNSSLAGVRGAVSLSNTGGRTAVNVNNQNDTTDRVASLDLYTSGGEFIRLTGLAPAAIYSVTSQTSAMTVNSGRGDDIFHILGTADGVATTLNGGDGNDGFVFGDSVGLGGIAGSVRLDGQTGAGGGGFARVNDTVGTDTRTYTWDGGTLRWGTVTVEAVNLGAFNLIGGQSDDVVAVLPSVSIPFSYDGGGGWNALDYSAYAANVYVNLQTGAATDVDGGLANIYQVTGGAGDDILVGAGGNYLVGGPGRDLLIAGGYASWLEGGEGDDLLVGGTTLYDFDEAALRDIRDGVLLLDAGNTFSNGGNGMLGGDGVDQFFGRIDLDFTDWDPETEGFVEIG